MSTEKLFTRILVTYKGLLSTLGAEAPRLRDYCKKRKVSYRDFLFWASTREVSSGIVEIERKKKRLQKEKVVEGVVGSSPSPSLTSCETKPVFYPLHITSDGCHKVVASEVVSTVLAGHVDSSHAGHQPSLRGVRITFPNGVKISVREADGRGIFSLVYTENKAAYLCPYHGRSLDPFFQIPEAFYTGSTSLTSDAICCFRRAAYANKLLSIQPRGKS